METLVENDEVRGVIVENKSGRREVLAKCVIDVSGEGDLAARAGASFEVGRVGDHTIETYSYKKDKLTEPVTIMMRVGDVDLLRYTEYQRKEKELVPRKLDVQLLQAKLKERGTNLSGGVFERIQEMYPDQNLSYKPLSFE